MPVAASSTAGMPVVPYEIHSFVWQTHFVVFLSRTQIEASNFLPSHTSLHVLPEPVMDIKL